ncbi:MAG: hypothetical protein GY940_37055, partial [bacterium]|nr:hypothetical protein [bacterium]
MKINRYFKRFLMSWIVLVLLGGVVLFSENNEEKGKENKRTVNVKRGAETVTIKGTLRSWKDADKRPLDQRSEERRKKPILNFNYEKKIIRTDDTPDPVVQRDYNRREAGADRVPLAMAPPDKSFAGMNLSSNGSGWPPDTNGDVGQTYYIQTVNASIGIYRKSDGGLVSATTFDNFFEGASVAGTPCDNENNGDPIVLYDQYAQRWFILDFAWASSQTDGSYYSIAVSKTSDPTGDWWQYGFRADNTLLNDYPKVGIWGDGIYITANMFQFGGSFQGMKIWAIKKPDIYSGTLTAQVVSDNSNYAWSLLPSNARGSTEPPAGSPNYMHAYTATE